MTSNLPLHRLFVQLESNGFYLGPTERLRIQHLLAASQILWKTHQGREELTYQIAPNRLQKCDGADCFLQSLQGLS
jgi:hypothetical protein